MKLQVFLLSLIVHLVSASTFSIMSYNIRAGVGMDDVFNLTRQAEVINQLSPDIVGLQEVDNMTQRHFVDEASILGKLTNMIPTFGKMRDFQGGGYGVAILTKKQPIERKEFHYFNPKKPGPNNCSGDPKADDYCQGAIAVKVIVSSQGESIWFITTHIGLYDMQVNEVDELVNIFIPQLQLTSSTLSIFVTGDFNSIPESEAVKRIVQSGNFTDSWNKYGIGNGFTFDSQKPFERIDYILQRPEKFICKEITVPITQASDHFPVISTFIL